MLKEKSTIYQGSKISTSLKVADIIVTSLNYVPKMNIEKEEQIKYKTEKSYLKLFVSEDKVHAGLIIGYRKAISFIKKIVLERQKYSENKKKIEELIQQIK